MSQARIVKIRQLIEQALNPEILTIDDQSAKHAGHAGAASGGGHFDALIVAEAFAGLRPLQRQRMVFDALGDMMNNEIHAFNMTCRTPDEV